MFSNVNLFSGLNNLENISLDPQYSTLCGYTDRDLDTVFAAELSGLDRNEIRRWYNGYSWLGEEKVYNPFDVSAAIPMVGRSNPTGFAPAPRRSCTGSW